MPCGTAAAATAPSPIAPHDAQFPPISPLTCHTLLQVQVRGYVGLGTGQQAPLSVWQVRGLGLDEH